MSAIGLMGFVLVSGCSHADVEFIGFEEGA